MATKRQVKAAKANVEKAQRAARRSRTIEHLPQATRKALGQQAGHGRARGGAAGHTLEDRNRQQLYEVAKRMNIAGRSMMSTWALLEAIHKAR